MRSIGPSPRRGTRPGHRGQGAVEFALVGGLFFFLVFSIVNAGFFLYGRNAMQHAADVGAATIAAEGTCTSVTGICATPPSGCPSANGDVVAICRMDAQGLTTTPMVKVSEVDVYLVEQSGGAPVSTCDSAGNNPGTGTLPCNARDCDSSGDRPGTLSVGETSLCEDRYQLNGSPVTGTSLYWPVGVRIVNPSSPDFARLVITFSYSLIGTSNTFTMSTDNVFRLEPQQ